MLITSTLLRNTKNSYTPFLRKKIKAGLSSKKETESKSCRRSKVTGLSSISFIRISLLKTILIWLMREVENLLKIGLTSLKTICPISIGLISLKND
tara:strand:- start:418 stop:705 length:288 start_codon:yes stop_codon:yes gene_type:complete